MNQRLKRAIERAAVVGGLPHLGGMLGRKRSIVLMYHNVVPTGINPLGDLSLHLRQHEFARQLDLFARYFDVVPLNDLVEDSPPAHQRVRIAITFDDAYAGALTAGLQELEKRRMPATIFVPPGLLGRETWWDLIAKRTGGEIPPEERQNLLVSFRGRGDAIVAAFGPSHAPEPRHAALSIATLLQLDAAAGCPGISIGSHTWTHPNLAALAAEDLGEELARPLEWLRDRFVSFLPFVSYPYGLSSNAVERAASSVGYRAGLCAGGGWLSREKAAHRFALPRFNVPANLTLDGLWVRLSGFGIGRH